MLRFLTFTAMVLASYAAIITSFSSKSPPLENNTVAISLGIIGFGFLLELKRRLTTPKLKTAKARA